MKFFVYYRDSLRDSYDRNPPKVEGVHFTHVATVDVADVGTVFRVMNTVDGSDFEVPQKIRNRSMSVGDVAVDETGRGFVCCMTGWESVDANLMSRITDPKAPAFKAPESEEEPIGCWSPGCYLAVDSSNGCCEIHGLPQDEV